MYTYSIKPKPIVSALSKLWNSTVGLALSAPEEKPKIIRCEWTKIQYNLWIENKKKFFALDDLVCDKKYEPIPNTIPQYYILKYIEELSKEVGFDTEMREPLAFTVLSSQNIFVKKCPGQLRHLNQEETALVLLQNRPVVGHA